MQWYKDLKISVKLLSGFIMVAVIAGVIGFIGIRNIKTVDDNDTLLYTNMTVPISYSADMSKDFQRIRVHMRNMVLENDIEKINTEYSEIQNLAKELDVLGAQFEERILSDEMRRAYDDFMGTRAKTTEGILQLLELARENRDYEAYALLNGSLKTSTEAEMNAIEKLVDMKVTDAKAQAELNTAITNKAVMTMIAIIVISMIIAIALGIYISRSISKPIGNLVGSARKIADGDLDVNIEVASKDEVGILAKAFGRMADNINEVMTNISITSEQVAAGSGQVSDSSISLSQGATEQASSIEELTASIEEISGQINQNAQNADKANEIAETAKANAMEGNEQMNEMLKSMDEINMASNNISKIIKVIDEIAFQTNILALNAAVEAARAGQHGKGFAVVAEEVRNLAARSANAAKETTTMIEGSIKKVEGGTRIANETAQKLDKIVQDVAKVANLVGDIAVASNEQASGVEQINQAVMEVSEVVQTTAATSEETAAASEELSGQAVMLREQTSKFKLKSSGGSFQSNDDNVNPGVFKLLDKMNKKKTAYGQKDEYYKEVASTNSNKISLSENEFGKY
ncbi:methyl-accepting chemotaxis protein [Peptoclostridium litorale DSM 5388]|uniref:Putative sensory transducer protein n=1 Tax=Peptoclostridium litorale DSM 5388 TaxID=1121324 RepID=A0A069RBZ0_PEPLI|nr:methyl-accepting chemotaxis protein [Peptoclostridium litorale]KDR94556.1 putative sensory transducer protein [Peptoclostridium litorale DSM 5388]SIO31350.1 methyl-accepting chemotaxis protein [Peptoclostridium litorale DSM 5388]